MIPRRRPLPTSDVPPLKLKIYSLIRKGRHRIVRVGSRYLYDASHIRSFSDTFDWSRRNLGAAQLALAILFDYTGDSEFALRNYKRFEEEVLLHVPLSVGYHPILGRNVNEWVEAARADEGIGEVA